jgi:chromosome partitioning protein
MSAKTISTCNDKGGVGKSIVTKELAFGLAQDHRVLLIDLAPESALTDTFKFENEPEQTIADVFLKSKSLVSVAISITEHLSLVAGSGEMDSVKDRLQKSPAGSFALKKAIASISDQFDYVVIDTQGNTDTLIINALVAADLVVVPLRPDGTDLTVTSKFLVGVNDLSDIPNATMPKVGLLITHFEATSLDQQEALNEIKSWGFKMFNPIGRSRKIGAAMKQGLLLRDLDHDNARVSEYEQFVSEVKKWLKQ